jgi:hypothetical protein
VKLNEKKSILSALACLRYYPNFARILKKATITAGLWRSGLEPGIFNIKLRSLTALLPCILKDYESVFKIVDLNVK